ncbi:MAG TPA: FAD-binding protein [Candidatus Udaeobacter sp.]|jgi:glycolate oxidase|nr:FAD-binding protein [Candidatus Udaeobacter sp.]
MTDSFFERAIGQSLDAFNRLNPDQRLLATREKIPDLNFFFDEGVPVGGRKAPAGTLALAASLIRALSEEPSGDGPALTLRDRVVTDGFLRAEADRDQNVYFGKLFTRTLTRAVPDLIFQPVNLAECARALRWGREAGVPVTLRGAASTAMGGAIPNDGGLVLDLSRLDLIDIEAAAGVCVIGAGARLRTIHQRLSERGFALKVYPSNLGGTLAGWFVTGGIGMNAFGHGRALDSVRAADVLLPSGDHVRFHDDGRLDAPGEGGHRRTLAPEEAGSWFEAHGYPPMKLADLAGSEGTLGLLVHLTVAIEPRPEVGAFLLEFASDAAALEAAAWASGFDTPGAGDAAGTRSRPANIKFLSGSHLHHTVRVWADEDSREWKKHPAALSSDAHLPWKRIAGPAELGAHSVSKSSAHGGAYLFIDFLSLEPARAFAARLRDCPGSPHVLGPESVRFAAERFRPMQVKRLGPGLLAAEIVMPADEVPRFLPRAERLMRRAGLELDGEVYYLADGSTLVIAGYLLDHRRGSYAVDIMAAPALLDLAMEHHRGRPYVLGRWQSPYLTRRFGKDGAARMSGLKRALDPTSYLNRGVLFGLRLRGALGALFAAVYVPGVGFTRRLIDSPLAFLARFVRGALRALPGTASGRGDVAEVGATFGVAPVTPDRAVPPALEPNQAASARALHCVNCGECNSVCPIFHESKIRLPQMLTHAGEAMHGGVAMPETVTTLLDLCMRCGNCEEVCQAGIPHLPLYETMQTVSNATRPYQRERHAAIIARLRSSTRYLRDFLHVRPGGYQKRAPASLAGVDRFILLRAENDAGPAASCIHCGACVSVCPTQANREFEGADPRWITTDQHRCIGCGTCVEVCPANDANGGQTLRVMEAPTRDWFVALEEFGRK